MLVVVLFFCGSITNELCKKPINNKLCSEKIYSMDDLHQFQSCIEFVWGDLASLEMPLLLLLDITAENTLGKESCCLWKITQSSLDYIHPLWTGLCLWWCLAQIVTALYLALMMADRMTHDDNAESRHQARPHPDNGQITQIMEHSRGQLSLSDDNIITPHQITAATPINIPLSQVSG